MKGSDTNMMKKISAAMLALVIAAGSGMAMLGSAAEPEVGTPSSAEVIVDDETKEIDEERSINDLSLPTTDSVVNTPDMPDSITAHKTAAGLRLEWTQVPNCDGYYVYRQHPNGESYGYNFVYVSGSSTTSYVWSDYNDSMKDWIYAVCAFNRTNNSGYVFSRFVVASKIIDDTIVTTNAPSTPVFTSYNKTYDAVRLFWNPVACIGYEVEYKTSQATWVKVGDVASSSTNVRISKLQPGTTYQFRIRAFNTDASGNRVYSGYSPEYSTTTTAYNPNTGTVVNAPVKTAITRADVSGTQVTFYWNAVTCDGYQIYYNTTGNSTDWKLASNISNANAYYTLTNLPANTNVWMTVRAYNKDASGNPVYGGWADNYKVTTGSAGSATVTAPNKVTVSKVGRSTTSLRLYWNSVECDGYQIFINSTGNSGDWKTVSANVSPATTNYKITGLQANHDYWLTIRAFKKNSNGEAVYGAYADNVKVTTKASSSSSTTVSAPAKVVFTKHTTTYDAFRVNWNAIACSGYEVYLNSTGNSGDWKQVATLSSSATTCRIANLAQGHTYWVTVRAFNKDSSGKNVYGAYADNLKVSTKSRNTVSKPASTTIYKTSASKNAVRLNWYAQNCDGYLVYTLINNQWKLSKGINGSGTVTTRITKLNPGTTYFFKVRSFRKNGTKKVVSADSNIVSVTTKK